MDEKIEKIKKVLTPYGIVITDEFVRQYENNVWVYSLVNIIVGQTEAMEAVMKEAVEKGVQVAFDAMERQLGNNTESNG